MTPTQNDMKTIKVLHIFYIAQKVNEWFVTVGVIFT